MTTLPIELVGDRPAVFLTDDLLRQLQAAAGDKLQAVVSANGIELVANAAVAKQLEIARRVMAEDREALRRLAE